MSTTFRWSRNIKAARTEQSWSLAFGESAKIFAFNIPALTSVTGKTTCPFAGTCSSYCYARQDQYATPQHRAVVNAEHNLNLVLKRQSLAQRVVEDLERIRPTHIRLHDSGDFFSRWYYEAWVEVAEHMQEIIFYGYTKSLPLLAWSRHPSNFRLVQSKGGRRDDLIDLDRPIAQVFISHEDRLRAGYIDGNVSDIPAIVGEPRIGLVYHGQPKLTEVSRSHLTINPNRKEHHAHAA